MASAATLSSSTPASLLLNAGRATVLAIENGQCMRVGEGELRILRVTQAEGGGSSGSALEFLACGDDFSYPLMDQPVLRSEARVFILPAGAQKHFVVYFADSVPTDNIVAFEHTLREATQLRERASNSVVPATDAAGAPLATVASSTATAGAGLNVTHVSDSLAVAIVFSGKITAQALIAGAELAGRGVQW